MKEIIKFTTTAAALKVLIANGNDRDIANKIVAVASIIKAFTKNVEIDVDGCCDGCCDKVRFYMKNTTEEERFNNATAYKALVNLIDPKIMVGALLWSDPNTTGSHRDVINITFFEYTFNTERGQVERREVQASKQDRELARQGAEVCLKMATEKLEQTGKQDRVEAGEQTQEWSMDKAIERSMDEDIQEQAVECAFDDDE